MKKPLLRITVALCALPAVGLFLVPSGCTSATSPALTGGGISQIVEARKGRKSCWGVVLTLNEMTFRDVIKPDDIKIVDGKYGRDLKRIMEWQVSNSGRTLIVRFKPNCGDFGTGNGVTVHIGKSAFETTGRFPNNRFSWSIATDIL